MGVGLFATVKKKAKAEGQVKFFCRGYREFFFFSRLWQVNDSFRGLE